MMMARLERLPQAPAAAEREDPPMGPRMPRRRHRLRYEGALEFDPTAEELLAINRQQVEAWIPKDHWLLHLPEHPSCASCSRSKIKRQGAFRTRGMQWGVMERVGVDLIGPTLPDVHG